MINCDSRLIAINCINCIGIGLNSHIPCDSVPLVKHDEKVGRGRGDPTCRKAACRVRPALAGLHRSCV